MFVNCEYEESIKSISEYGTTYAEEYKLTREFAGSNHGVMYFEYADKFVTASAYAQLRKFIRKENLPLFAKRRQNRVYIIKEEYNKMITERNND